MHVWWKSVRGRGHLSYMRLLSCAFWPMVHRVSLYRQYLENGNTKLPVAVQSVSQWNAGPATGRSVLQDLRSCAILQASLAWSPVTSSICCTHVRQGRPRWSFHSGLMSGLPPARVSTASRSAEWAGVASGSRRT